MKVAVVHDDFIQHGGAERLVLGILKIWPQADVYCVSVSGIWKREIKKQFFKEIKTTWIDSLPFKERLFRYYYSFYPLAVESFNFDGYDLVISSSARYAHGVLTKPGTAHVAYVNSPARFLWQENLAPKGFIARQVLRWHRAWDKAASTRPDFMIANSATPAKRIEEYWGRKADAIIYPFVDLERFRADSFGEDKPETESYFLVVTRLSKWKRVDIAIEACNKLSLPLLVVGEGEEFSRLKRLAGPTVKFSGRIQDGQLPGVYRHSRALIMTQEEDFGVTSLEAQACGKPVIAWGVGGALETVVPGITGAFFEKQDPESLQEVLEQFDRQLYIRENCIIQARKFGFARFRAELLKFCEDALQNY